MKYVIDNEPDGTPTMVILATTRNERRQLARVYKNLAEAHLVAVHAGKAGRFNTCGSESTLSGQTTYELGLRLALGGNVEVRYVPDPADKK